VAVVNSLIAKGENVDAATNVSIQRRERIVLVPVFRLLIFLKYIHCISEVLLQIFEKCL
jgi:hypothetical protein